MIARYLAQYRENHGMSLKIGVVMDPIQSIHFKKDTTLALLWAALDGDLQLIAYLSVPKIRFGEGGGTLDAFQRRHPHAEKHHSQQGLRGFGHGAY